MFLPPEENSCIPITHIQCKTHFEDLLRTVPHRPSFAENAAQFVDIGHITRRDASLAVDHHTRRHVLQSETFDKGRTERPAVANDGPLDGVGLQRLATLLHVDISRNHKAFPFIHARFTKQTLQATQEAPVSGGFLRKIP